MRQYAALSGNGLTHLQKYIGFGPDRPEAKPFAIRPYLFDFLVYLSSLPVAHLSDAPRRRLVVTGDSARIQDETTESSAWFFNVLDV